MKKSGKITLTSPVLEASKARDDHKLLGPGRPGAFNSLVIERDLSRYYALLRRALKSVDLTEAEASLICDAMNGTWLLDHGTLTGPSCSQLLNLELHDAITLNGLDKKWGVEEGPFAAKVSSWTELQCLAVTDAVERFWMEPQAETGAKLREVGLVRAEVSA